MLIQQSPAQTTPEPSLWSKVKAAVLSLATPAPAAPDADAKPTAPATRAAPAPSKGMRISNECLRAIDALGKGADPITGARLGERYPRAQGVNQHGIELRERFPRTP